MTSFNVKVTLKRVSGPEQDDYTLLDYFAGTIGKGNAAPKPLRLTVSDGWGNEEPSVYEVDLVEEA